MRRTTGWMEEKEEVTRAERPRGESSRLRFSHVTADAPIRVRSTDSTSSPRRIMGGGNFLSQRMRGNDVENRKECPIGPLYRFFSLSILPVLLAFHSNSLHLNYACRHYTYNRYHKFQ